jgi:hypothetical protein
MSCVGDHVIVARTILKIVFGYIRHDGRLVELRPLVGGQIYRGHSLMGNLMELRIRGKDDSTSSSLLIVILVVGEDKVVRLLGNGPINICLLSAYLK